MDPALVCFIAESCEKTLVIEKGGSPVGSTRLSRQGIAPVLAYMGLGLSSLSVQALASPAEVGVVGIASEARKEIRIRASVRPTMRVRQLPASATADGSRTQLLFCVWSNSPIGRYDVGIKLGSSQARWGAGALPARLAWGGTAAGLRAMTANYGSATSSPEPTILPAPRRIRFLPPWLLAMASWARCPPTESCPC